jgi:hypothetical protein
MRAVDTGTNARLVQDWARLLSPHELDSLLELFTDDVIYEDVALGAVNVGKEALRAFAENFLLVFPDITLELASTFTSHGASRPPLTSRPVNRVGAVAPLLEVRSELALRRESTTHVLDYDGVPGLHGAEDVERDTAAANHCVFLVVRRARHEHRRG